MRLTPTSSTPRLAATDPSQPAAYNPVAEATVAAKEAVLKQPKQRQNPLPVFGRSWGQALAEFALTLPVILLVLGITLDFGRVYYYDLGLRDASFAAARYADMNPSDDAGIKNAAAHAAPSGALTTAT